MAWWKQRSNAATSSSRLSHSSHKISFAWPQVSRSAADHPGVSLIPTADCASTEALSPRPVLLPAECPEQREVPLRDDELEAHYNHVGGCLRGVLFALVFQ